MKEPASSATTNLGKHFSVREFVRWGDVDKAGIICYGAYVRFFEIAETEIFRAIGYPYSILFDRFDFWLPRVQLHFDFRSPAFLDDLLEVSVWVENIGCSSLKLGFTVSKVDGAITAEGHVIMVAIDRQTFRPVAIAPELLAALQPYRADT